MFVWEGINILNRFSQSELIELIMSSPEALMNIEIKEKIVAKTIDSIAHSDRISAI